MLWRVLGVAIAVAVLLAFTTRLWRLPPQWQEPSRWTGCALIVSGLALLPLIGNTN